MLLLLRMSNIRICCQTQSSILALKAAPLFAFVVVFRCSDSGTVVLHLRRKQRTSEHSCGCIRDYHKCARLQTLLVFMVTPLEPWWEPCWLFKAEPLCRLLGENCLLKFQRRQRLERLEGERFHVSLLALRMEKDELRDRQGQLLEA